MKKNLAALSIAAALVAAAPMTHAADEQGLTVASPELVALAGFPEGATLYVAPAGTEPTDVFGSTPVMTSLAGNYFRGRESSYAYTSPGGRGDVAYAGGDVFADAHLDLPSGVLLESVRWWANDTFAADLNFFVFQSCLPAAGPGSPVSTVLGSGATTGTGGNQTGVITLATAAVINNNTCHYWFRANFGGAVGMTLQAARVQWRRQVSAAPAAATFPNDVPTTHPIFRFVEAFAASGLTGGCAAGSFCPDQSVTRGQLAVFMSVALGLHFPN